MGCLGWCASAFTSAVDARAADTGAADVPSVDISTLIPASLSGPFVKTWGTLTGHRAFMGTSSIATELGGMEMGLETTLVHTPSDLAASLPAIPMVKLHFNKSWGSLIDFGFSGLYYPGFSILGGSVKYIIFQPEEGLEVAARASYAYTNVDFKALGWNGLALAPTGTEIGRVFLLLKSRTVSTEVLIGKKLEFAEPYAGLGYSWLVGQVDFPIKLTVLEATQTLSTPAFRAQSYSAFTGVKFRMPGLGFQLGMEGSYSSIGMHYLGTFIGFGI